MRVYTGSNYWYGDVTIEEGANFTACENKDNGIEILPEGILDMQDGTVTLNHSSSYGGGLYNRGGTAKIGGKAEIYNTMQILQVTIFIATALIKIRLPTILRSPLHLLVTAGFWMTAKKSTQS